MLTKEFGACSVWSARPGIKFSTYDSRAATGHSGCWAHSSVTWAASISETTKAFIKQQVPKTLVPYGDTDSLLLSFGGITRAMFDSQEGYESAVFKQAQWWRRW